VAKTAVEFTHTHRRGKLVVHDTRRDEDDDDRLMHTVDPTMLDHDDPELGVEYVALSDEESRQLAQSLSGKLSRQWSAVAQGVSSLDALFGYQQHNMLDLQVREARASRVENY
jgi:hypothetical protein